MELTADVRAALTRALERSWHEDAAETVTSLLDAAVAVSLPEGRALATRACEDANVTVREHAARALRALGAKDAACPQPGERAGEKAGVADAGARPEGATFTHPVRVSFEIAGEKLAIVFEPELTPLATQRFVELARAGFYRGIVVHRVVPGYVVQFGDPGGDGYGGSGTLLRCETSPVPFDKGDVGVALAGRDTGSSQLFVTLARYPKLDGEYARVGRASGDWERVAEGDVIDSVTVEE
jgi:cyclophilin family peptidyl-prolyl cis-trans isomerase